MDGISWMRAGVRACRRGARADRVGGGDRTGGGERVPAGGRRWAGDGGRWLRGWLALGLGLAGPCGGAQADPAHVERAVLMLRAGCQMAQARLDIDRRDDGRLWLTLHEATALRARVSLVHADVQGFTERTLKLQGTQSLEASACMGQAVNQIIGGLLALPPDVPALPLAGAGGGGDSGGGYRPPTIAAPQPAPGPAVPSEAAPVGVGAPPVVAAVVSPALAPADGERVFDSGPFRWTFEPVVIDVVDPNRRTELRAVVGVELRNTGPTVLKVAVAPPWPGLHADGGWRFVSDHHHLAGAAIEHDARPANCAEHVDRYTELRPGQAVHLRWRLASELGDREVPRIGWVRADARLMVRDTESRRCWLEPVPAERLGVRPMR